MLFLAKSDALSCEGVVCEGCPVLYRVHKERKGTNALDQGKGHMAMIWQMRRRTV